MCWTKKKLKHGLPEEVQEKYETTIYDASANTLSLPLLKFCHTL